MSEWQPIETAPRDGTHILACHAGRFGDVTCTFNQVPPSVVHWFGWPEDAAGFYLSVALGEQKTPFEYTHWKPLGPEPGRLAALSAQQAPAASQSPGVPAGKMLAYELDGVIIDVEEGNGFDEVCLRTIKRVRASLAAPGAERVDARDGERDRIDAERYRWLREHSYVQGDYGVPRAIHFGAGFVQTKPELLDAAIDAARLIPGQPEQGR